MYLLLVDHNFISSADLQEMIKQAPEGTDIVNCLSTSTLLKLAEKLSPEIVIIDFDLVSEDLADLFGALREKSSDSHVMALIDTEHYDKLYQAIDLDGVDDYMVKPIIKEEFFARIRIATKKKKPSREDELDKSVDYEEDTKSTTPVYKYEDDATDPEIMKDEGDEDFKAVSSHPGPEDFDFFEQAEAETEPESEPGFKPEPGSELDSELETDQQKESEPEPLDSYNFDDIMPEETSEETPQQDMFQDEETVPDAQDPGYGLFDEPEQEEAGGADPDLSAEGDPASLFDDETYEITSQPEEDSIQSFEDTLAGEPEKEEDYQVGEEFQGDDQFETVIEDLELDTDHEPEAGSPTPPPPPGPDVVKPADEFIKDPIYQKKSEPEQPGPSRQDNDDSFFDELFAEEPRHEEPKTGQEESAKEEYYKARFPEITQERKESGLLSSLPGESADDFLFGDKDEELEDPDQQEDDQQGYLNNQELLDEFTSSEEEKEEKPGSRSRSKRKKTSRSGFSKYFTIIGNLLFVILLIVMAALSFFLIQSRISGGAPQVAGYQMYIVLSGSMSPEFDTGSLAFVREIETDNLRAGDIITYRRPNDPDSLTTHRIVEVREDDELKFVTRGDANNVNDPNPVLAENVVGKVTGSVPYVGYLMNFVQTTQGLILLIFVPGVLIIVFELGKIMKYLTQGEGGKNGKKKRSSGQLAEDGGE